ACPNFFFSSRRRHTRFSRDWSSDVCSSDLIFDEPLADVSQAMFFPSKILDYLVAGKKMFAITSTGSEVDLTFKKHGWESFSHNQIGRASCRERVEFSVGGASEQRMAE